MAVPEEAQILYRNNRDKGFMPGKGHTLANLQLFLEPLELRLRRMMLAHQPLV